MNILRLLSLFTINFLLVFLLQAEGTPNLLKWYSFRVEAIGEVAGTSELKPELMAKALGELSYIKLEHVRYFDGAGNWKAPLAPYTETLFLRPQSVISITPLTGEPKDFIPNFTK